MSESARTPIVLRPNAEASFCYTCAKSAGIERPRSKEGIAACEQYKVTFVPIGAGHSWDYLTRWKQELTFTQCRSCFDAAQAKRTAPKEPKKRASSSVAPADLAAMITAAVAQALGNVPPEARAAIPGSAVENSLANLGVGIAGKGSVVPVVDVPAAAPANRGAIQATQDAKLEEQRAAIRRAMDAGVLTAAEGAEKLARLS